jgi:hypothetical protein
VTDLELLIFGAVVSFLAAAGAYVAIRHRANESPVDSYKDYAASSLATPSRAAPSHSTPSPSTPSHAAPPAQR